MKYKTTLVLVTLMALSLFSTSPALSQTETTSETTFYVH